jgi:hypothetical protein
MKKILSPSLIFLLLLMLCVHASGQTKDTLEDMRTFLKVCNAYKQLPLQLDLTIRNSTNFVLDEEDTLNVRAQFRLQQEGGYIGFGELEEVVDDSLILIVSNKLKRMVLYANQHTIADQLKRYLGFQQLDSSVLALAQKFTVSVVSGKNDTAGIELKSRNRLAYTTLPKASIRIQYNRLTAQPIAVVQTIYNLMPLTADLYDRLRAAPEYKDKLLSLPDSSYCLIRDKVATFTYEQLAHTPGKRLPVMISDRIVAEAPGRYAPVKAFGDYLLTHNL